MANEEAPAPTHRERAQGRPYRFVSLDWFPPLKKIIEGLTNAEVSCCKFEVEAEEGAEQEVGVLVERVNEVDRRERDVGLLVGAASNWNPKRPTTPPHLPKRPRGS